MYSLFRASQVPHTYNRLRDTRQYWRLRPELYAAYVDDRATIGDEVTVSDRLQTPQRTTTQTTRNRMLRISRSMLPDVAWRAAADADRIVDVPNHGFEEDRNDTPPTPARLRESPLRVPTAYEPPRLQGDHQRSPRGLHCATSITSCSRALTMKNALTSPERTISASPACLPERRRQSFTQIGFDKRFQRIARPRRSRRRRAQKLELGPAPRNLATLGG